MEKRSDNDLIAEFMGLDSGAVGYYHLKYESDWNLLMPVVEKIKNMDWESMLFGTKRYMVTGKTLGTPIQDAYKAVVEFIKWYNNQQSNG